MLEYLFIFLILLINSIYVKYEAIFHPSVNSSNIAIEQKVSKMNDPLEIYYLLQEALPELKKQTIPQDSQDFANFRDWMNEHHAYMQYVEIKEFYDNGISDSEILKHAQIDTKALEKKIGADVNQIIAKYGDKYTEDEFEKLSIDEQFDIQIELDYEIEQALFNNIKNSIKDKHLKLFVVIRENPYWFVLPDNSDKNQKLLEERDICFEDIIVAINSGNLLSVRKNSSENHQSQDVLIVEIDEYVYYVPFVKNGNEYYLKKIIPSRKLTKEFLGGGGKNE
mgnify:CR=1 FL=1